LEILMVLLGMNNALIMGGPPVTTYFGGAIILRSNCYDLLYS